MTVDDAFALPVPGGGAPPRTPAGYRLTDTPYGIRLEAPDGGRLLHASPGASADPPVDPGADSPVPHQRVDLAIVDVVESPGAIGALRRAGVVGATTAVVAVGGDHRVHSPDEFARRARLWGALAPSDGQELACPPSAWPPERIVGPHRVLVTGGARSGKSTEAERRLLGDPEVTYVATGPKPEGDESWARRVAAHQGRRPWWWRTEETLDVACVLGRARGAVLFDCVGTWLAGVMEDRGMWRDDPPAGAEEAVWAEAARLVEAWRTCPARIVAVTNEVGSGVVPGTVSGGLFRDWLGRLNQMLSAESEEVVLATAGRVLQLP
ncbi:bifunctional adenosylcobinamide kinase/adenosylcobinamide-phosphate guanylyltransferase [Spinactinospora alkalitolerans]|uniref:bifunctional adenosylcobinamide kinase/adenosylcobinamide-phosphate guanylyltransferase n=1 Tax=Spinactinospora alkalitolerans TaxID=687207 RepID=UPI0035E43A04